MSIVRVAAATLLAAFAWPANHVSAADAPAPPPVEAFGAIPAVTDAAINPSGTRLSWIDNTGQSPQVVIYDLARRGEFRRLSMPADTTPRAVSWANDKTILVSVTASHSDSGFSRERRQWQRWFSVDIFGGEPRMLLTRMGGLRWNHGSNVIRRQTSRPGKIYTAGWDYRHGFNSVTYNLYEVDLKSGDGRVLQRGESNTRNWAVDETGKIAARSDQNETDDRFSVHVTDSRGWRRIYESRLCGRAWELFLAPDRNSVLALGKVCDDKRVKLWSLPFDGTAMRAIVEDPVLDVEDVVLDPEDGTVLAAKMSGMDGARRWLDPRAEQRQEALRRFFDTEWISTVGHSSNNERLVVKAEGKSKPPVYHVVDFGTKRADIINEAYSGLSATKFGPVRVFNYESRDLYPLVARLTFPPESVERNLPLVVLPHDGPEDRDGESFDWEAQFLASRGYAVLQPQFRGSTGFGLEHADAGRRQWGLRMQDDVTDAVHAVIAQGVADPKRVCIVGHGYGGYVALTGAAATPTLYACSVSISGISDLTYMLGHISRMSPDAYSPERKYWRDHIGRVSDSHVAIYSPARNAGRMTVPILLIHGSHDDVVPISQSRVMARALKESGNPADLIELQDEDHWMSQSRNRIRMLTELERFLAKNMPASGATN